MEDDFDYGCDECCCGTHGGPDCPWRDHEFVVDPQTEGECLECGNAVEHTNHIERK